MSGQNFNIKGLDDFFKQIENIKNFKKDLQKLIEKHGQKIMDKAILKTPVDTGQLRRSWTLEKGELYIKIFNNTEYGIHVEYGHRTRGGKSYIEGVYMLKKSFEKGVKDFEKELEKLLEKYGFK